VSHCLAHGVRVSTIMIILSSEVLQALVSLMVSALMLGGETRLMTCETFVLDKVALGLDKVALGLDPVLGLFYLLRSLCSQYMIRQGNSFRLCHMYLARSSKLNYGLIILMHYFGDKNHCSSPAHGS